MVKKAAIIKPDGRTDQYVGRMAFVKNIFGVHRHGDTSTKNLEVKKFQRRKSMKTISSLSRSHTDTKLDHTKCSKLLEQLGITADSMEQALLDLKQKFPTTFEELNANDGCDHRFEWIPKNDPRNSLEHMVIECYKCRKAFSPRMINDFIELVQKK